MLNQVREKNTKKASGAGKWSKEKTRNAAHRNGFKGENGQALERLLSRKQWSKARRLIQDELVYHPADHWLWMHLGLTYYEQKDYEKSLKCAEYAVQLQPDCPLALWHYAGSLHMTGSDAAAFAIWTTLLGKDIDQVAFGEHGEGMNWALQLLNDVHFRVARYYLRQQNNDMARQSLEKYLHNRRHGVGSIYEVKDAEKYLAKLGAG